VSTATKEATVANPKIPPGAYSDQHDGLLDPNRFSPAERMVTPAARLTEELRRRTSPSPVIRRLQAATDRALGRKGRR